MIIMKTANLLKKIMEQGVILNTSIIKKDKRFLWRDVLKTVSLFKNRIKNMMNTETCVGMKYLSETQNTKNTNA